MSAKEETGPRRTRVQQLWEAVMRIEWPSACPMRNPRGVSWEEISEEAQRAKVAWSIHYQAIADENRSRLSKWQMNIRDSVAHGGGKEVSKWLHPPRRPVVFQSDGKLVTHPAEIVERLRDSWQPIMTQERGKERMRKEDMQLLLRGMPVGKVTLPRLTGQMLRETAGRKRPSAPGSDKLSLSLLRDLPLAAWEELSEVLRAIEEGRARRMAVPSLVSARAAQLAEEWLPMVVGPSVLGGISGRSCKLASRWEDLLWDAAEAAGRPCISTFCDASKCFDNLPLEDVWELARSLGMPGEVLGPLSKWQARQERRICYENWVSEQVYYDRGIVQGDPLSVSLCLLWGATWHNMLRNNLRETDFGALVYMDDFMFSVGMPTPSENALPSRSGTSRFGD